ENLWTALNRIGHTSRGTELSAPLPHCSSLAPPSVFVRHSVRNINPKVCDRRKTPPLKHLYLRADRGRSHMCRAGRISAARVGGGYQLLDTRRTYDRAGVARYYPDTASQFTHFRFRYIYLFNFASIWRRGSRAACGDGGICFGPPVLQPSGHHLVQCRGDGGFRYSRCHGPARLWALYGGQATRAPWPCGGSFPRYIGDRRHTVSVQYVCRGDTRRTPGTAPRL